jgi:mannosyltransferase
MARHLSVTTDETARPMKASIYAMSIVLLALVLRLYHLGSQSLWIDEGFSLRDALHPDIFGGTRPFYFLFLWMWLKLGAHSEFMLRLPSALCGAAGVWMLYATGRRLVGTSAALLASAFMAISVLHINHSQEIRMYSLAALLALAATYLLIVWLERGQARYLLGYCACMIAGLLTAPLTVLILAAHGLFLLLYIKVHWPRSLMLIAVQLVVLGMWGPWLYNNMHSSADYGEGYTSIIEMPTARNTVEMLGKFFLLKWVSPGRMLAAGAFGFSAAVLLLALNGLRRLSRTDTGLVLVLLWLVVPMAGMTVLSYSLANMWMVHYLIAVSPAFFLLLSKGIGRLGSRWAAAAILLIAVLTLGRLHLYFARNMRPAWEPAISFIQAHERPNDVIGIYYGGNQYVFGYYYRGWAKWAPVGGEAVTREHFTGWNDDRVCDLLSCFPLSGKRFWLVLSNHSYAGGPVIVNYVRSHYRVLSHRYYSHLELILLDSNGRLVPHKSTVEQAGRS